MLYKESAPALGTSIGEEYRLNVGIQPEGNPVQPVKVGSPEMQLSQSTLVQSEVPIPHVEGFLIHQVVKRPREYANGLSHRKVHRLQQACDSSQVLDVDSARLCQQLSQNRPELRNPLRVYSEPVGSQVNDVAQELNRFLGRKNQFGN